MGWQRPNKTWKRMISLLTILALMFTSMPVSLATGNDASPAVQAPQKIVMAEEATLEPTAEPTPTPDATETPVVDPTPDVSLEPTVTPEETVSPEPSLSPSPSPLPYGFAGMPEDFVLSDEQMQQKEVMISKDVVSSTDALEPGSDYVDNQVMFWADSREYAETVAAAYNGELIQYSNHIALVELQSATVLEALTVAADTTNNMPALDANHIIRLDPDERYAANKAKVELTTQADVPTKQTWFDRTDDPFLQNPTDSDYQWMHDVVNTYEAWGVTTGSSSVKVAVIDSGVMTSHEDLAGKVTVVDMIGVRLDDTHVIETNDDTDGHGTHVAGIIAATADNGKGGSGIAPGVSILSLAALPGGEGTDFCITVAVGRAVEAGADIINMSFGSHLYNQAMGEAIQDATANNVACIAAMGNDGTNAVCFPAGYLNVIAVAAVNSDLRRANFSNYGSWADIAAPGVDINSCVGTGESAYESWDGTSMATPVVSGVAALYLSKVHTSSVGALEKKLKSCVNPSGSSSIGVGVIDAAKLFSADRTPPKITVKDPAAKTITSFTLPIPLESTLTIEAGTGATNAKMILYTTDGSMPSVKNGAIVNGTEYTGEINLSGFKAGVPITVKAICISGLGITSSSSSVKFTLALSSSISDVTMSGVDRITAGAKTTYTASVLPIASVSQKVLWSITARTGAVKAVISSTGVLTTVAKDGGEVTIRATSVANPNKYVEKNVTIENIPFLKAIKLDTAQVATSYSKGESTTFSLAIASATNALNQPVVPDSILRKWSSSNTKVVTIDQNGLATVVGSGTASIKCLALDGSGKYASCAVSVAQRVESIAVKGQASIAPGKTATYKASILPSNAKVKSVDWSLDGAPAGVTISKTSGVVSVSKTVTSGSFTVYATTKDGSGLSSSMDVSIAPLSASIVVTTADDRVVRNSYGTILSATIFTLDTEGTPQTDNILQLGYSVNGNNTTPVWSSSNTAIATVDQTGLVTGLKAGSATITCATQDGSGRKAAMKVTVIVPISYLTVGTKMSLMDYEEPTIAFGKSATNTVAYGDTFGTPTIKKVKWSFEVWEYDNDSADMTEVTAQMVKNKRVSLTSSGVLTVSSAMLNDWREIPGGYLIYVTATAMDGSGVSDTLVYWTQPATTTIVTEQSYLLCDPDTEGDYAIFFYGNSSLVDYTITSSNPGVAGVYGGVVTDSDPNAEYPLAIRLYTGIPGYALITIKANDGTNRYTTIPIIVG